MSLDQVYATLPQQIYSAQKALEAAIEAYGEAGNAEADAEVAYRKAKADALRKLRDEKTPVGMASDLAAGETAELKGNAMKAEAQKKKAAFLIDGFRERIFNLRHLGRDMAKSMGESV